MIVTDLLSRQRLWCVAAEIIRQCPLEEIRKRNQVVILYNMHSAVLILHSLIVRIIVAICSGDNLAYIAPRRSYCIPKVQSQSFNRAAFVQFVSLFFCSLRIHCRFTTCNELMYIYNTKDIIFSTHPLACMCFINAGVDHVLHHVWLLWQKYGGWWLAVPQMW